MSYRVSLWKARCSAQTDAGTPIGSSSASRCPINIQPHAIQSQPRHRSKTYQLPTRHMSVIINTDTNMLMLMLMVLINVNINANANANKDISTSANTDTSTVGNNTITKTMSKY